MKSTTVSVTICLCYNQVEQRNRGETFKGKVWRLYLLLFGTPEAGDCERIAKSTQRFEVFYGVNENPSKNQEQRHEVEIL